MKISLTLPLWHQMPKRVGTEMTKVAKTNKAPYSRGRRRRHRSSSQPNPVSREPSSYHEGHRTGQPPH
jgi:hypothetical protein